jgi:hypothetical protein
VQKKKNPYEYLSNSELFESPELNPLHFCLWGWLNREVYRRKMDTRDELLAHVWMLLLA